VPSAPILLEGYLEAISNTNGDGRVRAGPEAKV
jgi:hypothetical protein